MKRAMLILAVLAGNYLAAEAHDRVTTAITWNREISRIVFERCASCHREGGTAFSMMSYREARPWAVAIKEEVLSRRMPPWGAIKGFGEFRNDQALTPEHVELIVEWVEGGVPEGDPKDLPAEPKIPDRLHPDPSGRQIVVSGDFKIARALTLDGLWPETVPDKVSLKITAEFPDGNVEPLLWLYEYKSQYRHPFLLRTPLDLPPGTFIRGVPRGSKLVLLPAATAAQSTSKRPVVAR